MAEVYIYGCYLYYLPTSSPCNSACDSETYNRWSHAPRSQNIQYDFLRRDSSFVVGLKSRLAATLRWKVRHRTGTRIFPHIAIDVAFGKVGHLKKSLFEAEGVGYIIALRIWKVGTYACALD